MIKTKTKLSFKKFLLFAFISAMRRSVALRKMARNVVFRAHKPFIPVFLLDLLFEVFLLLGSNFVLSPTRFSIKGEK